MCVCVCVDVMCAYQFIYACLLAFWLILFDSMFVGVGVLSVCVCV